MADTLSSTYAQALWLHERLRLAESSPHYVNDYLAVAGPGVSTDARVLSSDYLRLGDGRPRPGMPPDALAHLVSPRASALLEELSKENRPRWWRRLAATANHHTLWRPNSLDYPLTSHLQRIGWSVTAPFHSLLAASRSQIRRLCCKYAVPSSQTIEEQCEVDILEATGGMAARALLLELHIARLRGTLIGDSPSARFEDFLQKVSQRRLPFLEKYPVLARHIVESIARFRRFHVRALTAFFADRRRLAQEALLDSEDDYPIWLSPPLSDPHNGLSTVRSFKTASGSRLVYKPRSLWPEAAYSRVVRVLNDHGMSPSLPILPHLLARDHGWQKFVEHRFCVSDDELSRFYFRQGANVALLLALNGSDTHYENVIACGEEPYIVDLETLFQPRLLARDTSQLEPSVLQSGFLPWKVRELGLPSDISALAAEEGQPTRFIDIVGTDDTLRVATVTEAADAPPSSPTKDVARALAKFQSSIETGFARAYDLLRQHSVETLSAVESCSGRRATRVLLRPTDAYSTVLAAMKHPDNCRDATDAERCISVLDSSLHWLPRSERVRASEAAALRRGEVPRFTARFEGRELRDDSQTDVGVAISETAKDGLARTLSYLGSRHRDRQLAVIDLALRTVSIDSSPTRSSTSLGLLAEVCEERAVEIQIAALRRLVRVAADMLAHFFADAEPLWYSARPNADGQHIVGDAGLDLYHGAAGTALFLAYASRELGNSSYEHVLNSVIQRIRRDHTLSRTPSGIGLTGIGGLVYALAHIAVATERDDAMRLARLIGATAQVSACESRLDIMEGCAGLVKGLSALYSISSADSLLQSIVAAADVLVRESSVLASKVNRSTILTGYAHGAAGMADALGTAAQLTGADRYLASAARFVDYERDLFSAAKQNWPDLRPDAGEGAFSCGWCHGAPGIGLSRISLYRLCEDPEMHHEIDVALRASMSAPLEEHSLCHGAFGLMDFILEASRHRRSVPSVSTVRRVASYLAGEVCNDGFRCGVATPRAVTVPGLFLGVAGVGYVGLRLLSHNVPSVLSLEPPVVLPSRLSK